jgi:sugar phosphate permease
MLKYKIIAEQNITHDYIGVLDGAFLAFYSLGLFCTGMLVDNYTS